MIGSSASSPSSASFASFAASGSSGHGSRAAAASPGAGAGLAGTDAPTALRAAARRAIAGVDEAGRGPLAGPVYAAAVVLDSQRPIAGLADSKALSPARRERLAAQIRDGARAWAVAAASVEEIDRLNILQASLLAMRRAVRALALAPCEVWVDGNRAPSLEVPVRTIVRGDATVPEISAASILAKTARDAGMQRLAVECPGYGFDRHMGYGTPEHLAALRRLGACVHHRRSFAPVRDVLEGRLPARRSPAG
jgi:ribonuclease HII